MKVPTKITTSERVIFFYLPALVLAAAFIAVCVQSGTPWPWSRVVHEDGRHTLLGTIFYFEHATRELVLDSVLALAVAGAVRHFYPPSPETGSAALAQMRARFALGTAVALAVILGGTAYVDAFGDRFASASRGNVILENLAQFPTRDGAPFAWGAHWRYHLIERFAEIVLVFCVAGIVWLCNGRPGSRDGPRRASMYITALVVFVVATLVFRPSLESFRDPTFLGHQLRELLTHSLVTLPLALGTCFWLARRFSVPSSSGGDKPRTWPIYAAGAIAIACGGFVLVASILQKAQTYGQRTSLAELIFPHFFEHSLGYAYVAALAGLLYLWRWPRTGRLAR